MVICGSAFEAADIISSTFTGDKLSGKHSSVIIDKPNTLIDEWFATITSGTVLIPTTSAPIVLKYLYSALVSRLGPGTETKLLDEF